MPKSKSRTWISSSEINSTSRRRVGFADLLRDACSFQNPEAAQKEHLEAEKALRPKLGEVLLCTSGPQAVPDLSPEKSTREILWRRLGVAPPGDARPGDEADEAEPGTIDESAKPLGPLCTGMHSGARFFRHVDTIRS